MKKFLLLALLSFASLSFAQTAVFYRVQNFTSVKSVEAINNIGGRSLFWRAYWNPGNSPAACNVAVDSSVDNVTWVSGNVFGSQSCTTPGAITASVAAVYNYLRITVSALTTGKSVSVTLAAYESQPTDGGPQIPVISCASFPGSDAGAKINACISGSPAGAVWDARSLTSSPTAASTIAVNKKGKLLMPPTTLTSSASTNSMLISAQGAEVSCDNTANNYGGGPCILATTNATAHVVGISTGAVSVHDLSLQYSGAGVRTGGSGLKFYRDSGATGGNFYRLEIDEGLWIPINMAEGATVAFRDIRITGTAGGTGRLWTAWQIGGCQAAGTPAEMGCSTTASVTTDSSYFNIIIGYNIAAQSGAVMRVDAGVDTPEFNYLLIIASGDCQTITACGKGMVIENTTAEALPALARPNWVRCYSCIVENVGGGFVTSEPAVHITAGRSIRFDGNTAMVCGAQCFLIAPGTGATDDLKNARVVDSVEITGIISAQAGQEIIRLETQAGNYEPISSNGLAIGDIKIHHNRLAQGSLAATNTYSTIYVSANIERFHIESNNFDRFVSGVTQKPKYFVEIAAGTSNNYVVAHNQFTAAHRGTGDFLDGGTGVAKIISPNMGDGSYIVPNGVPYSMQTSAAAVGGKLYIDSGASTVTLENLSNAATQLKTTGASGNVDVIAPTRVATSGIPGQINIKDSANGSFQLNTGLDSANTLGWIQARNAGTANWHLALSPNGAGVSIGSGASAPPTDGLKVGKFIDIGDDTFANLGTPANGFEIYCTNCDTPATQGATCTSVGDTAGAWAKRVRGAWQCY